MTRPPTMRSVAPLAARRLAAVGVCAAGLATAGCALFGAAAYVVTPQTRPAAFKLPDAPTLVLVDDPAEQLGDARMAATVAVSTSTDLRAKKAVAEVIDQQKLADFAVNRGDAYKKLGVVNVGRALGARQVIHVHIRSTQFLAEPGLLKPVAMVDIKVLTTDEQTGAEDRKLFPPTTQGEQQMPIREGAYALTVNMEYRVTDADPRQQMIEVRRRLADKIGFEVARLFYRSSLEEPDAFGSAR